MRQATKGSGCFMSYYKIKYSINAHVSIVPLALRLSFFSNNCRVTHEYIYVYLLPYCSKYYIIVPANNG
jgi:hypothetical protein